MGTKGLIIGGLLGALTGPLGAIIGAVLGSKAEEYLKGEGSVPKRVGRKIGADAAVRRRNQMIFCASAAAMLAKLAKADGHVTADEIASVEAAFVRLGFSAEARELAIKVFRKAKDDAVTVYAYAREFAAVVQSVEVRELLYELLWDVACSDGVLAREELNILKAITADLNIRAQWFEVMASEWYGHVRGERAQEAPRKDELVEAYDILGVAATATDEEIRKAYRAKAKKYHPDVLRAQGLPEGMIEKATATMAKINAAWAKIKEARRI